MDTSGCPFLNAVSEAFHPDKNATEEILHFIIIKIICDSCDTVLVLV